MTSSEGVLGLDHSGEELLAAIMTQGLPTPLFVVNNIDAVSLKRRNDYKKMLLKQLDQFVPVEKLHVVEADSDALRLLQQIGCQKQRQVYQRNMRAHLLCEQYSFKQDLNDPTVGTLIVDGYIRYQPLNVNGLVHIPGWGDFQMERIEVQRLPGEFVPLEEANPSLQETLQSENDVDPMNGEQTWPYQEEMDGKVHEPMEEESGDNPEDAEKKKRVPKGTSEYQAAWIKDDEAEDEDDDDEDDASEDWDYEDMSDDDGDSNENKDEGSSGGSDEDEMESLDNEAGENNTYDKKVSFADEQDDFKKIKGITLKLTFKNINLS